MGMMMEDMEKGASESNSMDKEACLEDFGDSLDSMRMRCFEIKPNVPDTTAPRRGKVFSHRPSSASTSGNDYRAAEADDDAFDVLYSQENTECKAASSSPKKNSNSALAGPNTRRLPIVDEASPSKATSSTVQLTPEDFANLLFCDSSEENDTVLAADSLNNQPYHNMSAATIPPRNATARNKLGNKKKRRRRVSFGASIPELHHLTDVPPSHAMTPEEKSSSWFSRDDLEDLKRSAQSSIQEMRRRVLAEEKSDRPCTKDRSKFRRLMTDLERDTDSSVRGLENRVFKRKATRKTMIQDVVECQAHVTGLAKFGHVVDSREVTTMLARVSRERSQMARTLAYVDAKIDYRDIYEADDSADTQEAADDDTVKSPLLKRQRKQERDVERVTEQARQVSL